MSGLITELKRRNVFRVAIAYVVVAWLTLQVIDILIPMLALPDWVSKFLLLIIIVGFPFAMLFAWAFELTPDGLKRDKDVDRSESITPQTGRSLDRVIIIVLVLAVGFLMTDKFVLQDGGDEMSPETSVGETASAPDNVSNESADLSIAVLPFVNMSSDKENEYFADGLSEELLNKLTRVPDLRVTGRTSSFAYKGQTPNLQDVGKTLGVANILEGSVRRQNDQVRITAQLVRASDGFHLWSDTYDRTMDDVFAIQDEIAQSVTDALNIVLDANAVQKMRNSGVREVDAFIAYQKGLELYVVAHGSDNLLADLEQSKLYFDEAIRLAPNFTSALFLGTDYQAHRVFTTSLPLAEREEALVELRSTLDRAADLAEDPLRRAFIDVDRSLMSNDWKSFPERIQRASSLPGCASPNWYEVANVLGDPAQSVDVYRRLIACDPLNPLEAMFLTNALIWAGEPEEAADTIGAVRDREGGNPWIDGIYSAALLAAGRIDEGVEIGRRTEVTNVAILHPYAMALAAAGQIDEAHAVTEEWLADAETMDYRGPGSYSILGDREEANRWAAFVDAQPGGPAILTGMIHACMCGAPFDIDQTPNFKARMNEAGFSWPPPSPIQFPAKDW